MAPAVCHADQAVLLPTPQDQLIGERPQTGGQQTRRRGAFPDVVVVDRSVPRVAGRRIEAEQAGGALAIDREAGGGARRCSGLAHVHRPVGVIQPPEVPLGHTHEGVQMMRQGRRLGLLAVRVVRHHRLDVLFGEIEQCRAIVMEVAGDLQ